MTGSVCVNMSTGMKLRCDSEEYVSFQSSLAIQHILLTVVMVTGFLCTKTIYDKIRRRHARITVVVIGGGPVGLTAVVVAVRTGRVGRVVLYEEMCRNALVNKQHQIAFDAKTVLFLQKLGVDFDNMEGCWEKSSFFTRIGIFEEYLLSVIYRLSVPVEMRLGCKFGQESIKEAETIPGRCLIIACDGANGQAVRLLGLSDEFEQHSCSAYGAVAALDRMDQPQVPLPERRVQNLHFDLVAYGSDAVELDGHQGFSLKIFGSSRNRYMSLVIPKSESPLVKQLRVVLDRSMMRNIFMKCFNTYKSAGDNKISDSMALKHMKFSHRLFEIKLSQRVETVAYYEESDTFVITEGESSRCYNIHTGLDVNVGLAGLMVLSTFISMITLARSEHAISKALMFKSKQSDQLCKDFVQNGLYEYMLSN